jgi:hypothetical protein
MSAGIKKQRWASWELGLSDGEKLRTLPPDLLAYLNGAPVCGAGTRVICTRLPGHMGRHAAGNGVYIVAVWPDEELSGADRDRRVEAAL